MTPAPTLRDVAAAAGVHPGTASRALNPGTRGRVSPTTVDRVLSEARSLGYLPNSMARALRTRRSATVGVLVPDIAAPVFPAMLLGVEETMAEAGYTTLIANTADEAARERRAYEALLERQVDGLVTATASLDDGPFARGVPTVLLNRRSARPDVSAVSSDDVVGIEVAVDHLVALGHRRIAHLGASTDLSTGLVRHRAFADAMAARGLPVDPALVMTCERMTEAEGEAATRALFERGDGGDGPTAVVTANDLLALGCLDALAAAGRSCPGDVSVTGYNDIASMDRVHPPLTTVRVPRYELGVEAARLLLEKLARPDAPPRLVLLRPELVVRSSTGPPPAGAG